MLDGLFVRRCTRCLGAARWLPLFSAFLLIIAQQVTTSVQATADQSPTAPAAITITVNTSADLDSGSLTKTCTYTAGIYVAATDGCTLRRAILEAAARPQSDRPIAVQFNLAANDPNKDKEVAGTWTLPIAAALPPLKTDTIINKNGQVTIDGDTQPGGRTTGPKIIIATNDNSLQVESTNNVIRNLAFKGGGVIFLKEDGNTVERIWMGLSDDGQAVVFRTPANPLRMAGGGIHISSDNNTVQNNVIVGAFARAIDIDGGDNNLVARNLIGTRADGTVPTVAESAQCLRSLNLDPQNWYGGWGIALSGSNNRITQNRLAGLHIIQSQNDTPPMAIESFGANHEIRGNIIGVDSANKRVGVCGQGIKVSGSGTQILNNVIVRSRTGFEDGEPTAILASDTSPLFGQITVRGNLVESGPGKIYEFGPGIPALLRTFNPAKFTNISGTTITGGSGDNSPCPGCLIDFYRDDGDEIAEALDHLGSIVADSNGNFTVTLTQTLPSGVGVRTSSTTQAAGVIGNYGAGTTTKLSKLYLPMASVTITGPTTGTVGMSYDFTVTVNPVGATIPVEYAINATNATTQTLTSNSHAVVATYTWPTAGTKTLTVTVRNELGTVSATHQIALTGGSSGAPKLYLPLVRK
ncbi:MAG: hypothetical protein DYG89_33530 [Caldilinea sp. CFX5]|nr:hypothetical protein [Caldilinea sp. CFX5]